MNINFIKWLVNYAEGFDLREKRDKSIYIWYRDFSIITTADYYKWFIYPLLLQRAKTGWNKECNSGERILEVVGNTSERYLKYGKYQNIIDLGQIEDDEALEQALKYIYEQETE